MENEYNKRFKNKEMSNDDFDVEGLWDNITEELDTTTDNPTGSPVQKYGGALFILLVLSGLAYILFDFSNTDITANNIAPRTEQKEISKKNSSTQNIDSQFIESKKSNKKNTSSTDKKEIIQSNENDLKISSLTNKHTDKSPTISDSPIQNTAVSKTNILSQEELKQSKSGTSINPQNNKKQDNKAINEITEIEKSIDDISINTETKSERAEDNSTPNLTSDTDSSNKENLQVKGENNKKKDPPPFLSIDPKKIEIALPVIEDSLLYAGIRKTIDRTKTNKKKEPKLLFEGDIYGGLNLTKLQFQSVSDDSIANQKNQRESSIIGQTYGLNVAVIYKNFRVNTGVEHHNLWTQFALKAQGNTTVLEEQVLTLVRIDTLGNTLSREFQDTTLNAVTIRNIEHYNQYQVWSIPLEFGFYRANQKWSYGISAGTSFNFLTNQSGRTSDTNNSIIDFDKTSDATLFQAFSMSLRANLFLAYHLSDKLRFTLAPKWSWTSHDIFNGNLKSEIQQLSLTVGLRSSF